MTSLADTPISLFGRIKSWAYWGMRGGSIDRDGTKVIKLRRGSQNGGSSNSNPSGRYRTRFYQGRFGQKPPQRRTAT